MLRRLLLLFIVLLPAVSAARAQRLPGNAHPQHYSLELAPDLRHATFTGTVAIDLTLDAPARSITLNAAELQLLRAQVTAAGQTQTAEIAVDATQEQATFTVPQPLPAGLVTLRIDYTGVLNDRLRGFYLSRTATRRYAVSDFEPTNARRAFPSFDEPAAKATFDVSITADAADTAISNTPLIADHRVAAQDGVARHTLRFATTPRISTYLVAFLVGDFRCSKGKADGVPIRVCATPDKRGLTKYSLAAATHFLSYYNQYFGIPYPMPKLDLVALPDMEEGAMENFGCITFRETELLLDARSATIPARKEVARTIAHEMAHQWFGDMVTMHWWNDLWLNEGFASWMEAKATAAWHPEWGIAEDAAQDLDDTLTSDSYLHTRAIRADATTPDAINELFDDIAYDKSAAVLGMVESYLGEATFQQGVHDYLAAHLYGTATAEDFWNAQTAVSRQPVDAVMRSFLQQPGVPLLRLGTPQAGRLPVTQQRLLPEVAKPQGDAATLRWQVPVCLRTAAAPVCALLRPDS
ncbi:MAG: M1 family peptidase, partial [Acidobacteriota bacterium]|nr:M1 family peptidase [Acidobacteriota bacterium]